MPRVVAIVIACTGLVALMAHAVWQRGPHIEADLATRTQAALAAAGLTNIRVEPDGQELTLRGSLGAAAQRQSALRLAQGVYGVTQVHDELQVLTTAQPPLPETPVEIVEAAAISSESDSLSGSASLATAEPETTANLVQAEATPMPSTVPSRVSSKVPPRVPQRVQPSTADACQDQLRSLVASESIRFGFGKTDIDPASFKLLEQLASTLAFCPYAVEVGGHTDSTGEDKVNQWYSERRAMAVRDYLVNAVSVNRSVQKTNSRLSAQPVITARGYGASRPRATNETRVGRRINRRIEFTVSEIGS